MTTRRASKISLLAFLVLAVVAAAPAPLSAGDGIADQRRAEAEEVYRTAGSAEALPLFKEVLLLYRQDGDRLGEAITLGRLGNCHKHLGDFDRALELNTQALSLKREVGDRLEEGKTLSHLGLVYWEMSDYPRAIELFEAAITLGRELDHPVLEGSALNNLSLVYDEQGDYWKSLEQYQRVLKLYDGTGFERGQGDTLGNIGRVYMLLGRYREALPFFERARAISESLDLKMELSRDLGNLALCHRSLGALEEAQSSFDQALALTREIGAALDEAYWLRNKGAALVQMGHYADGLELIAQAMTVYEREPAGRDHMEALSDLGELHLLLGDSAAGEKNLSSALALAEEIGSSRGVVASLLGLGELELRRGRTKEASVRFLEASSRAAAMDHRSGQVEAQLRLAAVRIEESQPSEARVVAQQALALARETETPLQAAEASRLLAESFRIGGEPIRSLELYDSADALMAGIADPDISWRIDFGRAKALLLLGREEEALSELLAATALIEDIRSRLREARFRAGYLQDKSAVYEELVRLLLRLGRVAEAFEAAERLRAQSYLESLETAFPVTRSTQDRARGNELRERIRQLERALRDETARAVSQRREPAVTLFTQELLEAERAYQAYLDDLRALDPGLRANGGLMKTASVAKIQRYLSAREVILEWVVGATETVIFVLGPELLEAATLEISSRELRSQVELLRDLVLRSRDDAWRLPAASLYARLIEPAAAQGWLAGSDHVFLVPHGVLHELPFAALLQGPASDSEPLVARYQLTHLPSAAALTLAGPVGRAPGTVLALAPERAALPHTRQEAIRIAAHFEDPNVLLGGLATERAFKNLAADYRVLHLASHGHFSPLSPLLSGLELDPGGGEDGRLQTHEILDLDLAAELVTLSACSSALGGGLLSDVPVGGEWVGLSRAFLSAGSEAVLATLWRVDDRSTMEFMESFYAQRARLAGAGETVALADVQRQMSRGTDERSHPYFWAPFVLTRGGSASPERKIHAQVRVDE